jgi:uncharacterized protein (DUF2252 family)
MNNNNNNIIVSKKNEFIDHVKRWVTIDTQQKLISEKTKKLRDMKNESSEYICNYMSENKADQNKISISDGELKLFERKEYSPLTFGYIEKCLAEIITDKSQTDFIIDYLKQKREIAIHQDIRRTSNKN